MHKLQLFQQLLPKHGGINGTPDSQYCGKAVFFLYIFIHKSQKIPQKAPSDWPMLPDASRESRGMIGRDTTPSWYLGQIKRR